MKIIAHRGNDGIHKENTMEAILNSLALTYIDGVEFDIRLTKDFHFVISHDPFYENYFIRRTKVKTLQKKGLNTLEEVLEKIDNQKIILIEIKEETKKYKILCAKLSRLLKKYPLNFYIFSFNYDLMHYLQKKYPDIKTGLLIGLKMNVDKINNSFDFNALNYRHLKKATNKETFIWTVDKKDIFEQINPKQNIITDKPEYIYQLETKVAARQS